MIHCKQQQHYQVFLIYHIFNKQDNMNLVHVFTFINISAIFNVDFDFAWLVGNNSL